MKDYELKDYLEGRKACKEGKPCPSGASKAFEQGYSVVYSSLESKSGKKSK